MANHCRMGSRQIAQQPPCESRKVSIADSSKPYFRLAAHRLDRSDAALRLSGVDSRAFTCSLFCAYQRCAIETAQGLHLLWRPSGEREFLWNSDSSFACLQIPHVFILPG